MKIKSKKKEMMIQEQKTLRLPDGRKLCYAKFLTLKEKTH
jgi:hypothetical protein